MSAHETMVKIIELRELRNDLLDSCYENCSNCKNTIRERIDYLINTLGKNVIKRPQQIRDHDMLIQAKELELLESMICDLCKNTFGECKEAISERLKELCETLERDCENYLYKQ